MFHTIYLSIKFWLLSLPLLVDNDNNMETDEYVNVKIVSYCKNDEILKEQLILTKYLLKIKIIERNEYAFKQWAEAGDIPGAPIDDMFYT